MSASSGARWVSTPAARRLRTTTRGPRARLGSAPASSAAACAAAGGRRAWPSSEAPAPRRACRDRRWRRPRARGYGARRARRAAQTACAASASRRRGRAAPCRSRAAQTAGAAICRRASSGRCWRGRRRSSPRSRRRSAWSASMSRRTAATFASVCGRREPRGRGPSTGAGPSAGRSGRTPRRIMEGRACFISRLYSYSRAEAIALFAVEIEVRRRSRMSAAKSARPVRIARPFPDFASLHPGYRL